VKHSETFEWIWASPFAQWLASSQELFWIRGKPASGKSTLMNHISQDPRLEECLLASRGSSGRLIVITFYFDFRQEQTLANTVKGMLLTIIRSLVVHAPDLVDVLLKAFPKWKEIYQDGDWDQTSLESAVHQCFISIKCTTCLLLDGLDEFCGDNEAQLDLARYLRSLATRYGVKICIASRPHEVITKIFGTSPSLDMHEWNLPGLKRYIFSIFDKIQMTSDPHRASQINDLSQFMAEMAEGVFLWTKFAVEALLELWKKENLDFYSLIQRLAELPRDVESLWDKRREQLSETERVLGGVLIRTICTAARPLNTLELFAMCERQNPHEYFRIKGKDPQQISRSIHHLTCGLLEVHEHDIKELHLRYYIVLLVHKSVRTYVDTKDLWLGAVESTPAEQIWLEECTKIIDESTFARERSLCYQHKDHDITNPVCKTYGCYRSLPPDTFPRRLYVELHDRFPAHVKAGLAFNVPFSVFDKVGLGLKLLRIEKLFSRLIPPTFLKTNPAYSPMLSYAIHWYAYHAWNVKKRRGISSLFSTNQLMCPELIMLMSRARHHSCAFCRVKKNMEEPMVFHGADRQLWAYCRKPDVTKAGGIPTSSSTVIPSSTFVAYEEDFKSRASYHLSVADHPWKTGRDSYSDHGIPHSQLSHISTIEACIMDVEPAPLHDMPDPNPSNSNLIRGSPKQRRIAVVGSRSSGKYSVTWNACYGLHAFQASTSSSYNSSMAIL
jgi:hypothetical protein